MICAPEPRRPRALRGLSPPIGLRKFSGVPLPASPSQAPPRMVLLRLPPFLFLPIRFAILPVSSVNLHVRAAWLPHLQFLGG